MDFPIDSTNHLEATKQSYMNTIEELNQQLAEMKEAYNQLDTERENLLNELEKQSLVAEQNQTRPTAGIFLFHIIYFMHDICFFFRESIITKHVERII